jgi:hypothetical protein
MYIFGASEESPDHRRLFPVLGNYTGSTVYLTRNLPLAYTESVLTILQKYMVQWEKDLAPIKTTFDEVRFDRATLHGLLISNTYDAGQREYWNRTAWFDDTYKYGQLSQLLLINELLLIIRRLLKPGGTFTLPLGYLTPENRDRLKECFIAQREFTRAEENALGITEVVRTGQYRTIQLWTKLIGYINLEK